MLKLLLAKELKLTASALSYLFIALALLAFCLGTLVTVRCFRLKRRREERRDG